MSVYLHGLAVQSFRGIGRIQKFAPFKDFNFFIGANNAGKSTILDLIHRFLPTSSHIKKEALSTLDTHQGGSSGQPQMGYAIPVNVFKTAAAKAIGDRWPQAVPLVDKIVEKLAEDEYIWVTTSIPPTEKIAFNNPAQVRAALPDHAWQRAWFILTQYTGGGSIDNWVSDALARLLAAQKVLFPSVELIPAIRKIGERNEEFSDYSGRGLIDRLAQAQNPNVDKRSEREVFDRINMFLENVTARPGAQIEIPHDRAYILVHMDDKILPLASLGTGIHEVIMIAAFCTLSNEKIVCIEEPELHLHPILQRKLITYLQQNTSNQYFISTHSASFIDTPDATIFHVFNDGKSTNITEAVLQRQRVSLCTDLGYRASDIVQTNCVIWVEGPSDRIYISHWIAQEAPDLIEGIHFSIMFYGGRLLSHLSANDEEISEFIGLRLLNQKLAIVVDSDRVRPRQPLNETKQRIVSEFENAPGMVWITKGREIENYIDYSVLQNAVRAVHPERYGRALNGDSFAHALYFERAKKPGQRKKRGDDGIERNIDKIKVARVVCQQPLDLAILDLKKRIRDLVGLIRSANS